jgi:hypothetical protein
MFFFFSSLWYNKLMYRSPEKHWRKVSLNILAAGCYDIRFFKNVSRGPSWSDVCMKRKTRGQRNMSIAHTPNLADCGYAKNMKSAANPPASESHPSWAFSERAPACQATGYPERKCSKISRTLRTARENIYSVTCKTLGALELGKWERFFVVDNCNTMRLASCYVVYDVSWTFFPRG